MPNTLHVDYEMMTHDESVKIIEDAMEAARMDYSLNEKIK